LVVAGVWVGRILVLRIVRKATVMTLRTGGRVLSLWLTDEASVEFHRGVCCGCARSDGRRGKVAG
jgi:hypothetical protein